MILDFNSWKLNEGELSPKEKEIFLLWKSSIKLQNTKVDGDSAQNLKKQKLDDFNERINKIIGDDDSLKEFWKKIKERVSLNKKENSLKKIKDKDSKTAEDYQKMADIKKELKEKRNDK